MVTHTCYKESQAQLQLDLNSVWVYSMVFTIGKVKGHRRLSAATPTRLSWGVVQADAQVLGPASHWQTSLHWCPSWTHWATASQGCQVCTHTHTHTHPSCSKSKTCKVSLISLLFRCEPSMFCDIVPCSTTLLVLVDLLFSGWKWSGWNVG